MECKGVFRPNEFVRYCQFVAIQSKQKVVVFSTILWWPWANKFKIFGPLLPCADNSFGNGDIMSDKGFDKYKTSFLLYVWDLNYFLMELNPPKPFGILSYLQFNFGSNTLLESKSENTCFPYIFWNWLCICLYIHWRKTS